MWHQGLSPDLIIKTLCIIFDGRNDGQHKIVLILRILIKCSQGNVLMHTKRYVYTNRETDICTKRDRYKEITIFNVDI